MSCAGDVLEGRYELGALLGTGGTARVFRATDLVTKATVAIKLMEAGREQDPEALAYFRQEGRLAARIRDPHLVPALHFGVDAGRHFIVYDYLPGSAPLSALADGGRVAPRRVCEMAMQVLYALDTLHRASVVHGDVSLNNCLWRERDGGRDEVRLCDLGSAWARSPHSAVSGGPTQASDSRGTAYCTAPELMNAEAGDHRADLWSVGAMMYTLMTIRDVDLGDPEDPLGIPPPALLVPKIPQAISDVVMRALAPADERYPSATAMLAAIRSVLANSPAKRGLPLWASIAGMAMTAGLTCSLATMAGHADDARPAAPAVAAGLGLQVEARPLAELPAARDMRAQSEPAHGPEAGPASMDAPKTVPTAIEPAHQAAVAPVVEPSEQPRPVALTWTGVERTIRRKAGALRPCFSDDFVSLGLRVANGRATLESLDDAPPALPRDRCVVDVISGLRFAKSDDLAGVVGLKLPGTLESNIAKHDRGKRGQVGVVQPDPGAGR